MNWLDSIKSVISTPREDERAPDAEYEAIAGEDGDELVRSTGSLLPREPSSDKAVYLAFWALGAGVLLSWNGKSSPHAFTDKCSTHMHIPPHDVLLRRRLKYAHQPRELSRYSLLPGQLSLPWSGSTRCQHGT